jgi:hypothetical protein
VLLSLPPLAAVAIYLPEDITDIVLLGVLLGVKLGVLLGVLLIDMLGVLLGVNDWVSIGVKLGVLLGVKLGVLLGVNDWVNDGDDGVTVDPIGPISISDVHDANDIVPE